MNYTAIMKEIVNKLDTFFGVRMRLAIIGYFNRSAISFLELITTGEAEKQFCSSEACPRSVLPSFSSSHDFVGNGPKICTVRLPPKIRRR